jgi:hypothetical protein
MWRKRNAQESGQPEEEKEKEALSSGSWNQATDLGGWGEGLQKLYLAEEKQERKTNLHVMYYMKLIWAARIPLKL